MATSALVLGRSEEAGQMRLDGEAGLERIEGGISGNLRGIDIQLLTPDQPRDQALLHDHLEEAAEDLQPIPLWIAVGTGVVRGRLVQIIAETPPQTQPVGIHTQDVALGTQTFKKQEK